MQSPFPVPFPQQMGCKLVPLTIVTMPMSVKFATFFGRITFNLVTYLILRASFQHSLIALYQKIKKKLKTVEGRPEGNKWIMERGLELIVCEGATFQFARGQYGGWRSSILYTGSRRKVICQIKRFVHFDNLNCWYRHYSYLSHKHG